MMFSDFFPIIVGIILIALVYYSWFLTKISNTQLQLLDEQRRKTIEVESHIENILNEIEEIQERIDGKIFKIRHEVSNQISNLDEKYNEIISQIEESEIMKKEWDELLEEVDNEIED